MKKPKSLEITDASTPPHSLATVSKKDKNIQIDLLERKRRILFHLGNDLTKVREKKDLIILFSESIKGLFYFTHTIVTLFDKKSQTYFPFLIDEDGINLSPFMYDKSLFEKVQSDFEELVADKIDIQEKYTSKVLKNEDALIFKVDEEIRHGNNGALVQ